MLTLYCSSHRFLKLFLLGHSEAAEQQKLTWTWEPPSSEQQSSGYCGLPVKCWDKGMSLWVMVLANTLASLGVCFLTCWPVICFFDYLGHPTSITQWERGCLDFPPSWGNYKLKELYARQNKNPREKHLQSQVFTKESVLRLTLTQSSQSC